MVELIRFSIEYCSEYVEEIVDESEVLVLGASPSPVAECSAFSVQASLFKLKFSIESNVLR